MLKLSRARRNDPGVKHSSEDWQQLAGADFPPLDAASQDLEVEFPEYDLRRAATARDPLAVIEGFRVHLLLRLATALGTRMCPRCPRCNGDRPQRGCQDKFGYNMRPLGGAFGGLPALGGSVEHQGVGTPHFHGEGHIVCCYQFDTLHDVAEKIRRQVCAFCFLYLVVRAFIGNH